MRQAYGPPPPESKTISAIERKGTRSEHRGAAPERQKRQERHAGEIIPPAPPCFRLRLRPRRGGSVQAKRVAENRRELGKTGTARGWCAWRALFGLRTQCRCALLRPPAVADSCPTKSRTVVSKERISRCFLGEHRGQFRKCRPESILSPLSPGDMGSLPDMLEGTPKSGPQVNRKSFFQRSGERGQHGISKYFWEEETSKADNADRKAFSQRSGARDLPSGGRADGRQVAGIHFRR